MPGILLPLGESRAFSRASFVEFLANRGFLFASLKPAHPKTVANRAN
jgi:hypothetical protein